MKRSLPILIFMLLTSCSIKEDRMLCPCMLDLTVRGGAEDRAGLYVWKDGDAGIHDLRMTDGTSHDCIPVGKGLLTLCANSGLHSCLVDGPRIVIPLGGEMDELYASAKHADSRCEELKDSLMLHKQFVRLHLSLSSDGGEYPYRMEVKGNVSGLDMMDLSPLRGPFRVALIPVFGTYHRICLPRQMDDSLVLEVYRKEDGDGAQPIAVLPLGEYMERAGLDWNEEDLDDVYLEVDYASMDIELKVEDWNLVEI